MKWEYFGTGLAFLGIGITMVLAFPPPWWPNMPRWIVGGGLLLGLVLIVYGTAFTAMGIWPEILRPKLLPILVVCLGSSILVAGLVWLFRIESPSKLPPETLAIPAAAVPKLGILLDAALEMLPNISPADGVINTFAIMPDKNGIQAYPTKYQFGPNAAINWAPLFPDWPVFGISKWEITSTTSESVFEAVVPIKLIFREMVPHVAGQPVQIGEMITSTNGKQMKSGPVVATKDIEIRIGRIQPQTPYIFYFVNRTEYLVDIDVPQEGRVENFRKPELDYKFGMKLGRTTGLSLIASANAAKVPQ
jgi:hypothetical protein